MEDTKFAGLEKIFSNRWKLSDSDVLKKQEGKTDLRNATGHSPDPTTVY